MNEMQVFQNSEFGELGVLEIEASPGSLPRRVPRCWATLTPGKQSMITAKKMA